jgi:peptide/nickel transport system substrate-binding protein
MIECRRSTWLLAAVVLLAAGCSGKKESGGESEEILDLSAENAVPGGTLVVGLAGDFDSLNELVSNDGHALDVIESLLYMSLTRYDRSLQVRPYLADRWEFSQDRRVLTYHLRSDVFWHDGVPTTARDVAFTLNAMRDPRTGYANADYMANVDSVVAVDDRTVRVYFSTVYATQLEDCQRPIMPAHLLADLSPENIDGGGFGHRPVGNGPYRFVRWDRGETIEFQANPDFCLGRPYLDRVLFRVIPDPITRLAALRSGEIDYLEGVPPQEVESLRGNSEFQLFEFPQRGFQFIAWNQRNPLFQDPRVRTALTLALDRREMVDALLFGQGHVLANPLMSTSWAFNRNILPYPHDPGRASSLLFEAGWKDTDGDGILEKNDREFTFDLKTNQGNQVREDAAVMAQAQLRRVGIRVKPSTVEWVTFVKDITDKKYDAVLLGWQDDFTWHPADQFHSKNLEGEYQLSGYSNPEADRIMDLAQRAVDKAEVARLHGRLQEILHKDQPYTVLYERTRVNALHGRFRGVMMDTRSQFVNITRWWVAPEERRYRHGVALK